MNSGGNSTIIQNRNRSLVWTRVKGTVWNIHNVHFTIQHW